jgi:23S rRNA (adenine2503-C2)-methyltransferase
MNASTNFLPVGKYINKCGEEGIRYAWKLDRKEAPYVESGAFLRRTKLGKGTMDENIRAYTTSVSMGCLLGQSQMPCKFCVTGNTISFGRVLTSREIALQNTYMMLDDNDPDLSKNRREFAYMGQGEPGFSYEKVKEAIIGTDLIVRALGTETYRHIFATSGVIPAVEKLAEDFTNGDYGNANILLHLSVHSVSDRDRLMPINKKYPLKGLIDASVSYAKAAKQKVVVNFLMFKEAMLSDSGPFTTASEKEVRDLARLLDPKYHRVILCEYNPSPLTGGTNNNVSIEEADALERILENSGFEAKRFISFGREDKLACGLLGGKASPNLAEEKVEEKMNKAFGLVKEYVKEI